MVFKTINAKLEKTNYTITINNIDASGDHWGSEKNIQEFLSSIEDALYDEKNFNNMPADVALAIKQNNHRIKDVAIYKDANSNKIIILAKSNVHRLHEPEILSREMTISFKKDNFTLSIIELLKSEEKIMEETNKLLPENWILDEKLNKQYKILSTFL